MKILNINNYASISDMASIQAYVSATILTSVIFAERLDSSRINAKNLIFGFLSIQPAAEFFYASRPLDC